MSQNPIKLFFKLQKYQQRLYFLLFFSAIFNAFLALIPNVALYIPEFECDLKGVLNVSVQALQVSIAFFDRAINTHNINAYKMYIWVKFLKHQSFDKVFIIITFKNILAILLIKYKLKISFLY